MAAGGSEALWSTIGLGPIGGGLVTSFMGMEGSMKDASEMAQIQGQMEQTQIAMNTDREQAMELMANRKLIQNSRNVQMARSRDLAIGVNQGGGVYGNTSGVRGGQSKASAEGGYNVETVNQDRQNAENLFSLENQFSQQKIVYAGVQSDMMTQQAWQQFGSMETSLGMNAMKFFS